MAKKKQKSKVSEKTITFEEGLESLETVIHQLESGELGLSESLSAFEKGVKHLKLCHRLLEGVERKVELLSKVDESGAIESEIFEDAELTLDEKAKSLGNRRSSQATKPSEEDDVDVPGGLF